MGVMLERRIISVRDPFACDSEGSLEQTKTTYVTGQAKHSRGLDFGMRGRAAKPLLALTICCACGGPLPTSGGGTGAPGAIAQVRLFDEERGTELTVHTGLPDDQSIRLQVRLYAPDGHRLTDIVGGVELTLQFSPGSLANAIRVPGRPLETIITPTAPTGTSGSQTVRLDFPGTGTSKSFGPFHVEVQPGISGVREFRVFDAFNADFTAHVPLVSGKVHLEASVFNGAHPNEVRTNFDYRGARFNSFSARVTVNPNEHGVSLLPPPTSIRTSTSHSTAWRFRRCMWRGDGQRRSSGARTCRRIHAAC